MKKLFTAVIIDSTNRPYSHLDVIATDELEARTLVDNHLFERRPFGFSEREIRKVNPKRTPWKTGLRLGLLYERIEVTDNRPIGVVCN